MMRKRIPLAAFPDEVLNAAAPARQAVAPERFIDWLNHPVGT
jgi:hypothetical protein